MGGFNDYKPAMETIVLQFLYSGMSLFTRAAIFQGTSSRVFIMYRQALATMVMALMAYFSRRKFKVECFIGLRSFYLLFSALLIGVTIYQNVYFEGLYLASSSVASAMRILTPVFTLLTAFSLRLEKAKMGSLRNIGTVLCVAGVMSMVLLKGPNLLNSEHLPLNLLVESGAEDFMLGCALLFASSCCWSIWLILKVPALENFPDSLSLSAWMCFMATTQSATVTLFLEPNFQAWNFNFAVELVCCLLSGIIGSGISFVLQDWCISQRGPLFSAMFNPLIDLTVLAYCNCIITVLASHLLRKGTVIASFLLHEKIYVSR